MARTLESTATTRTKFGGVAAVVAAAGIALAGGPGSVVAGVLLVGAWAIGGHVHAFALGQVLFVAIWADPTLLRVTVAQAGLFGLLVAPGFGDAPTRTIGAFVVSSAGLIGVVAGVRDVTGHFWVAMVALVATVTLCAYTLHRYQLVMLGLVEDSA